MKKIIGSVILVFIITQSFGQSFQKLDVLLTQNFPEKSDADGRWVYYSGKDVITRVYNSEVSQVLPGYSFYQVELTNYLGYHSWSSSSLILFDSVKSKIIHAVPIWYSDDSMNFLKLFIGKKFNDSTALLRFIKELQSLMIIGSTGKLEAPETTSGKVIFDMTYDSTNGKEIWRHFEVGINENTIESFKATNPKTGESVLVQ